MSLDVTLKARTIHHCPMCGEEHEGRHEVFDANITHNLTEMAAAAGIYKHVWRPDEIGVKTAGELVETLTRGIEKMRADPAHFRLFDSKNKWGVYDDFLPWLERYLAACVEHPTATIEVSR